MSVIGHGTSPSHVLFLLHSGVNDTCNVNDDNVYARCKRRNGCMLPVELKWHARMNRSNDKWIKCKKIESLCQGFPHKKIELGDFEKCAVGVVKQ